MPNQLTIWDDSDSEHEEEKYGMRNVVCGGAGGGGGSVMGGSSGMGNTSDVNYGCTDLYEDDEDSEAAPRYHSSSDKQR